MQTKGYKKFTSIYIYKVYMLGYVYGNLSMSIYILLSLLFFVFLAGKQNLHVWLTD